MLFKCIKVKNEDIQRCGMIVNETTLIKRPNDTKINK